MEEESNDIWELRIFIPVVTGSPLPSLFKKEEEIDEKVTTSEIYRYIYVCVYVFVCVYVCIRYVCMYVCISMHV